jgi:DedD protein
VNAWVVQLGSFAAEANAVALVETLKAGGFAAFIEPLQDGAKVSYRVRVGPELTRDTARQVRDKLAEKVDIKGIVMRYP